MYLWRSSDRPCCGGAQWPDRWPQRGLSRARAPFLRWSALLCSVVIVACALYPEVVRAQAWAPIPAPAGLGGASAVFDAPRHRLLVFGGSDPVPRNQVWAFQTAAPSGWSLVTTLGSPPASRANHGAIYDPDRDRMIVYGGAARRTDRSLG